MTSHTRGFSATILLMRVTDVLGQVVNSGERLGKIQANLRLLAEQCPRDLAAVVTREAAKLDEINAELVRAAVVHMPTPADKTRGGLLKGSAIAQLYADNDNGDVRLPVKVHLPRGE
jgi:hypothetical protein